MLSVLWDKLFGLGLLLIIYVRTGDTQDEMPVCDGEHTARRAGDPRTGCQSVNGHTAGRAGDMQDGMPVCDRQGAPRTGCQSVTGHTYQEVQGTPRT